MKNDEESPRVADMVTVDFEPEDYRGDVTK